MLRWLAMAIFFTAGIYLSGRQLKDINDSKIVKIRMVPPPKENIERLAFGYNDILADSLWLRTIQNLDECDVLGSSPLEFSAAIRERFQDRLKPVPMSLDPSVAEALKRVVPRRGRCSQGWAFQMMDAATRLAPRFEIVYSAGGIALSVMMDDYEGATILFDRGVKEAPHNWVIAYRAAYHFLYDVQDFDRAAELLAQAAKNGGPLWLKSLAARLWSQSGQAKLALPLLRELRDQAEGNSQIKKDLTERITKLEALASKPQ